MSFSYTGIPAYVEQNEFPLLYKSLFNAKTAQIMRKQPGVKGSATINIFDQDAVFQAGACGFNASGNTTLTQRTIVTAFMKLDKRYCPDDLRGIFMQTQLEAGSYEEEIPFEQQFAEKQAEVIGTNLETALWQGDKTSGVNNLSYFDGFIKVISGSGAQPAVSGGYATGSYHVSASSGAAAMSGSNVFNIINGIWSSLPPAVLDADDVRVFVGRDVMTAYQQYLVSANLYHYVAETDAKGELIIPGTGGQNGGIRMITLNGLNGTFKIFAGRLSNFVIGIDLEKDSSSFKMWFDESNQEIRFTCKWTIGVNVAFPGEIVYWYNGQ